jgi:hypothetical protein
MSGGIAHLIKFRTLENTSKYYWKDRRTTIDYPSTMLGTKTPSIFRWSKIEHMLDVMDHISAKNYNKMIVDGGGKELSPVEFLIEISSAKMWTFDRTLEQ